MVAQLNTSLMRAIIVGGMWLPTRGKAASERTPLFQMFKRDAWSLPVDCNQTLEDFGTSRLQVDQERHRR